MPDLKNAADKLVGKYFTWKNQAGQMTTVDLSAVSAVFENNLLINGVWFNPVSYTYRELLDMWAGART